MMSSTVIRGNFDPYAFPVRESIVAALVDPKLEPSMLEQTTKYRLVSMGIPGPTSALQAPSAEVAPGSIIRWLLV